MKEKNNKIFIAIIITALIIGGFLYFFNISEVEARSGCCSWHGGVCGCQCCDGTPLSSTCLPYYPECGGGFPSYDIPSYDIPSYDIPSYTPSIPDCPLNSYYDSISGSCKCYFGYVASGGKCISADQYCRDLFGFNARYNILTDSCECGYGYVISGNRCVSGDSLCRNKYGIHSSYDSLSETCKCDYGYVFDSNDQCVSQDDYCQDLYDYYAEYDSLTDKCVCKRGYVFNSSMTKCIDGNSYCRNKYGYHTSYDYWDKTCKCDSGYIFSDNKCIDGDAYCQNQYGIHSSYDTLTKSCECDYGYKLINGECAKPEPVIYSFYPATVRAGETVTVSGNNFGNYKGKVILNTLSFGTLEKISSFDIKSWSNNKIKFVVPEDKEPDLYYIRIKPSVTFSSEETVSSSKLEVLMPLPEIYSIFPLEAEIGKEITIQGENFGDDKYGDLYLYVGNTKVNSGNIISWWDDKITFETTDYLESGYVVLKDNTIDVRGSYLEILEPKEDNIPFYSFTPTKEKIATEPEFQPSKESQPRAESQSQPEQKIKSPHQEEFQPTTEEPQLSEFQEPKKEEQQEISNEQEQEQKKSIWVFLASIFTATKNFFYGPFR